MTSNGVFKGFPLEWAEMGRKILPSSLRSYCGAPVPGKQNIHKACVCFVFLGAYATVRWKGRMTLLKYYFNRLPANSMAANHLGPKTRKEPEMTDPPRECSRCDGPPPEDPPRNDGLCPRCATEETLVEDRLDPDN